MQTIANAQAHPSSGTYYITIPEGRAIIGTEMVSHCFDNNEASMKITPGIDVKAVQMYPFQNRTDYTSLDADGMVALVESKSDVIGYNIYGPSLMTEINNISGKDFCKDGKYCAYMLMAIYNAENGALNVSDQDFYVVPEDNDNWEYWSTYTLVDGIFASKFGVHPSNVNSTAAFDVANYPYDLEVEQYKSKPGLYRLVNPFGATSDWPWRNDVTQMNHNHNHYLYIDATDPNAVVVNSSPAGIEIEEGMGDVLVSSPAAYARDKGTSSSSAPKRAASTQPVGTFANDAFSFPANSSVTPTPPSQPTTSRSRTKMPSCSSTKASTPPSRL